MLVIKQGNGNGGLVRHSNINIPFGLLLATEMEMAGK